MNNLPLPPFDLPVTGDDRILASILTGARTDREILRSARYIRQYVDAEKAKIAHWLPMATAPKDGTEILVLFDSATVNVVRLCWWDDGEPRPWDELPNQPRPDDVGWWSYIHSVTKEKIEIGKPVGWLPMPRKARA